MASQQMFNVASLLGLKEEAVEKLLTRLGKPHRITERDGKSCICTKDLNVNRVNLAIAGGIVIGAHLG